MSDALPQLPPDEVHVWVVPLDLAAREREELAVALSAEERQRAVDMRHAGRRADFIVARAALRAILGGYCGEDPARLRFRYARGGKPELEGPSELEFNVSHSGALALCAVARGREVGVDVERIRERPDLERIAERFFPEGERQALASLAGPAQLAEFFRCWTRREARLKAQGQSVLGAPEAGEQAERWRLCEIVPRPGYVGALAAEGADWSPRLHAWRS